ncbi:hypothetical protein BGX26_003294, partial [Mortierella sp. AD094]
MPSIIKKLKNVFKSDSKNSTKKAAAPTTDFKPAVKGDASTTPAAVKAKVPVVSVSEAMQTSSHPENTHVNHTFAALVKSDTQLAALANHHYTKPVSAERVNAAKAALEANGFKVHLVNSRGEAFETLKGLIPAGASVNNAHSTTLEEIGFITYLKGET